MSYKIAIIGEAYGEQEDLYKRPFCGPAGQELDRILSDAGIRREDCFLTNVFNLRPPQNDLGNLCGPKSGGGVILSRPLLVPGKYLLQQYACELDRVYREITSIKPNVAVLLGNTACWAFLRYGSISKIRGTARLATDLPWLKVLPTYHPAAVLRQYDLRHVTVLDFAKAVREAEFPELRRPEREIWLYPSLPDMEEFYARYLANADIISFDIETSTGEITCLGFGTSTHAIVIPFVDLRRAGANYWPTLEEETAVWSFVARVLASPVRKVGQNTLYDIQYLWMKYGIPVNNYSDDTMLLHHALFPESPKGLGFLGSVYTNEISWKADRHRAKDDTIKREDE